MADKGAPAFIATLLHAATGAHILHLNRTKRPGSYAEHMALDTMYNDLPGLVDDVAEQYQAIYGVIPAYPTTFDYPPDDPITYVRKLYDYVDKNRGSMGKESFIQNSVDEICSLLASTLYKLKNLQ